MGIKVVQSIALVFKSNIAFKINHKRFPAC